MQRVCIKLKSAKQHTRTYCLKYSHVTIYEFVPTCDADGNQTKIQTSTGIWDVTYNALNRPISFTSEDESTAIECAYDYMGRRATKKVTVNGEVTLHQRYLYRGYLQIACVDLTRSAHPCLWLILWDPTQPIATRPLAIQKDGTWYTYGRDLTKNICEVFGPAGYIRTTYTYTPFGTVTAEGDVTIPIQWSSEFHDEKLGLVYYNYRHYSPRDGRWINRDPIGESGGWNLYNFAKNKKLNITDRLGLYSGEYWSPTANMPINPTSYSSFSRWDCKSALKEIKDRISKWNSDGDTLAAMFLKNFITPSGPKILIVTSPYLDELYKKGKEDICDELEDEVSNNQIKTLNKHKLRYYFGYLLWVYGGVRFTGTLSKKENVVKVDGMLEDDYVFDTGSKGIATSSINSTYDAAVYLERHCASYVNNFHSIAKIKFCCTY